MLIYLQGLISALFFAAIFKARSAFSKQLCLSSVLLLCPLSVTLLFVWENLTSVSERYIFANIF